MQVFPFSYERVSHEKGGSWVLGDEILRCAQNDKGASGTSEGAIKHGLLILRYAQDDKRGAWFSNCRVGANKGMRHRASTFFPNIILLARSWRPWRDAVSSLHDAPVSVLQLWDHITQEPRRHLFV